MSPTTLAANTLSGLIDDAWTLSARAIERRDKRSTFGLLNIVGQLDACRTRLVQEGVEYIADAWMFIAAGRRMVQDYKRELGP